MIQVWSLSMDEPFLTVHLMLAEGASEAAAESVLASADALLAERFSISHSTIQIEKYNSRCLEQKPNHACHSYEEGAARYRTISSSLI